MKKIIILVSFFISFYTYSQIAIGKKTFNPHAQLDVTGTQKGVLIPRVTLKDLKSSDPFDTGVNPLPESLLVYNIGGEHAVDSGYYYWSNNKWNKLVIEDELGEVIPDGKDLSSKELSITPDGKGAVLKNITLTIKDQAVTPAKIEPGIKVGQILGTKEDEKGNKISSWESLPDIIKGETLSSKHLQVDGGEGAVLKKANLTIKDNIIATAMLINKNVTPLKIEPSKNVNQILTTNNKKEVVWADSPKVTIANKLVSEGSGENILSSTVNGVNSTTSIVKKVENTLATANKDGYPLRTTVNGVSAPIVNIPEPWNVAGSTNKATTNDQDIYQKGRVAIGKDKITDDKQVSLEVDKDVLINGITVGKGTKNITTNTVVGYQTLLNNTTGKQNIAVGYQTLLNNTTGKENIAVGYKALQGNTNGTKNTAIGDLTLYKNGTGDKNVAIGSSALYNSSNGTENVAIGELALYSNETGDKNVAIGSAAFYHNISGHENIAIGFEALQHIEKGVKNVAIGAYTKVEDTPDDALISEYNTVIGYGAEVNRIEGFPFAVYNSTAIGHGAVVYGSDRIQIGNDKISSITAQVPLKTPSDRRWKKDIKTIPLGLDFINKVHPVEYIRINNEEQTKEWGVIAQDLQLTLEDMGYQKAGIVDEDGSPDKYLSVRYTDFIAPVIKAIQELTKENEDLKKKNDQMASEILKIKQLENKLNTIEKRIK